MLCYQPIDGGFGDCNLRLRKSAGGRSGGKVAQFGDLDKSKANASKRYDLLFVTTSTPVGEYEI